VIQEILEDKIFLDMESRVQVAEGPSPDAPPELDLANL
jgi:hypothetical protein